MIGGNYGTIALTFASSAAWLRSFVCGFKTTFDQPMNGMRLFRCGVWTGLCRPPPRFPQSLANDANVFRILFGRMPQPVSSRQRRRRTEDRDNIAWIGGRGNRSVLFRFLCRMRLGAAHFLNNSCPVQIGMTQSLRICRSSLSAFMDS